MASLSERLLLHLKAIHSSLDHNVQEQACFIKPGLAVM